MYRESKDYFLLSGGLDGLISQVVHECLSPCYRVGMHIYARGSANGKRVQSNMGAKNHATLNALAAAGFGAGQRCMALSTVAFVGDSKTWEDKLVERAQELKVNVGTEADTDLMHTHLNQHLLNQNLMLLEL